MAMKISDLKNGMSNVTLEGAVRRKSDLCDGKNGKYFCFYLHDAEHQSHRIVAFKQVAEKLYDQLQENKSYQISKVTVREHKFKEMTELQVILTLSVVVTAISDISTTISCTPLSTLKNCRRV